MNLFKQRDFAYLKFYWCLLQDILQAFLPSLWWFIPNAIKRLKGGCFHTLGGWTLESWCVNYVWACKPTWVSFLDTHRRQDFVWLVPQVFSSSHFSLIIYSLFLILFGWLRCWSMSKAYLLAASFENLKSSILVKTWRFVGHVRQFSFKYLIVC